ncbi:MAG: hypothetical protein V4539_20375 [Bacteroidota bacterium]
MKRYLYFLLFSCLLVASCTKDTLYLAEDPGCIQRVIIPVTAHSIAAADIITADNLLAQNNIPNNNFQYYRYQKDSTQTFFPPFAKFENKVVRVNQYTNGERIFNKPMLFHFKNGVFDFQGGDLTKGTSLNTTPLLNLGQLRKLFIDDAQKFDNNGGQYKNTCLTAQFGYYDLNAGDHGPEVLVKAWKITGGPSPIEYPEAYYKDDDGTLIYYFNGIQYAH